MKTTVEILKEAYGLIKNPAHWAQGCFCRKKNGNYTDWDNAHSYCANGAILAISYKNHVDYTEPYNALKSASFKLFGTAVIRVNDDQNLDLLEVHKNICLLYEEAITEAELLDK